MKIAVVTGASSGMGREFVYAIDRDFELDEIIVNSTIMNASYSYLALNF